jgi:hypothetical protein
MNSARGPMAQAALIIIVGVGTLSRFAPGVRGVAVVGLTGSGAALAVGIGLLVFAFRTRSRAPAREPRAG